MKKLTRQMETWSGNFGREYTDRNAMTPDQFEQWYLNHFGVTRTELNKRFVGELDRDSKILEVGSNVGNQLRALQAMGFKNLYGIELQPYAVEQSKKWTHGINIVQGSAFDIPFKDVWFDVVFTSGVLIHIHLDDLSKVMREIHRCSRAYIWGMEYFAEQPTEVSYRGNAALLWKADYAQMYLDTFSDLRLVKREKLKYKDSANIDEIFLLKREMGRR